ncbi:MAG: chorismate mutase, partial [Rhodospirillales bacterium]|nr:chorismate mutase [Rhodospirillales bacterium]
MTDKPATLTELRNEIDRIDTLMHDLIMERTLVVDAVKQVKEGERVKIRPGREAEMLYRLSARHNGKFPKQALFRIWREMISGTLTIEGPFCVAILTPDNKTGYVDLARDHYGGYTDISTHETTQDVISAVATDQAAIGV